MRVIRVISLYAAALAIYPLIAPGLRGAREIQQRTEREPVGP